mmetsp:Transcript_29037/g.81232  ORF Transcript_29037/g.81232 Transcript_29037/m.81232 type:complete len:358 (-) Transcript_29037:195-1268(-)
MAEDELLRLPSEVLVIVVLELDNAKDVLCLSATCRRIHEICTLQIVWRRLTQLTFPYFFTFLDDGEKRERHVADHERPSLCTVWPEDWRLDCTLLNDPHPEYPVVSSFEPAVGSGMSAYIEMIGPTPLPAAVAAGSLCCVPSYFTIFPAWDVLNARVDWRTMFQQVWGGIRPGHLQVRDSLSGRLYSNYDAVAFYTTGVRVGGKDRSPGAYAVAYFTGSAGRRASGQIVADTWERLRSVPLGMLRPPHGGVYNPFCTYDQLLPAKAPPPGTPVEIQWKLNASSCYGWWRGFVETVEGDDITMKFPHFDPGGPWYRCKLSLRGVERPNLFAGSGRGLVAGYRLITESEQLQYDIALYG